MTVRTLALALLVATPALGQEIPGHIQFDPRLEGEEEVSAPTITPLPEPEPSWSEVLVRVIQPDAEHEPGVYRAMVFLAENVTCPKQLDLSGRNIELAWAMAGRVFFDSTTVGGIQIQLPEGDEFAVGNYLVHDGGIWTLQQGSCTTLYVATTSSGGRVTGYRPVFDPVMQPINRRRPGPDM